MLPEGGRRRKFSDQMQSSPAWEAICMMLQGTWSACYRRHGVPCYSRMGYNVTVHMECHAIVHDNNSDDQT